MNNSLFKALGSSTRIQILKMLTKKQMHITGLANELKLSVPVVARHVKVLEKAGLVQRTKFGRTHVLRSRIENIGKLLDMLADTSEITVPEGSSILDALRKVSGVEMKRVNEKEFVISIDGEQGFYIYEVNGKPPDTTVEEFRIEKDAVIEWKKLIPITRKRIVVRVA